ncbi:MAG: hypothetical protein L6R36_007685 [Xanthoria steineri]|nr:MAG: hypothetical protein L6R36_007685 [Xanthoria steineri]
MVKHRYAGIRVLLWTFPGSDITGHDDVHRGVDFTGSEPMTNLSTISSSSIPRFDNATAEIVSSRPRKPTNFFQRYYPSHHNVYSWYSHCPVSR